MTQKSYSKLSVSPNCQFLQIVSFSKLSVCQIVIFSELSFSPNCQFVKVIKLAVSG